MTYQERLLAAIPGGAHTYSRGFDQHPANAPQILLRGKGAYVYTPTEAAYLDYGMALRAVTLGYAEPRVNAAAWAQIEYGNNLTRPSMIELEAAELLIQTIESVEMVKFTKNGSTAVTAAVKLARAYTGRPLIARCAEHPFFSFDDWFIGSTVIPRGVPDNIREQTKLFAYNDLDSLQRLVDEHRGQIACVVMEAATDIAPAGEPGATFLHQVQALCRRHGIVFILDEMITGFRWHVKGAQHFFGIEPDLCTFGKAMANGFSVAAIGGRREIMQLGSIERSGAERVFLLSTTHGAEMSGLGAFVATLRMLQDAPVIDHLWEYGTRLIDGLRGAAAAAGVSENFVLSGYPCSPSYTVRDHSGAASAPLRTLFMQEMVKRGVLMPWIALSYAHGETELARTLDAADAALRVLARGLVDGVDCYLEGPSIKPVFRRYN